jgi:glycine betaine/proline transport system ATP-binding protein
MRDPTANDDLSGPTAPIDEVVRDVVSLVADNPKPVRVMDNDRMVGIVDRVAVLRADEARS